MSENIEIIVQIQTDSIQDPELLDTYSRRLRNEVLELDVDSFEYVSQDEAPTGSKGTGASAVGDLILSLTPLSNVLTSAVGAVQSFVNRNHQCSITMEIGDNKLIISEMSPKEQQKLVDAWIKSVLE